MPFEDKLQGFLIDKGRIKGKSIKDLIKEEIIIFKKFQTGN